MSDFKSGHRLLINETDEPNDPRVMATRHPASEEAVRHVFSKMIDGPTDLDGRSGWYWVRLPNGDLILGLYPHGETYFDVEVDAEYHGPTGRVMAHFKPEAWVNGQAIEVDPMGEQNWDVTNRFWSPDMKPAYRMQLVAEMNDPRHLAATDNDDFFKGDPKALDWVREWSGPFTITLEWSS